MKETLVFGICASGLAACASQRPIAPETQLAGHAATRLVLELPRACTLVPGGPPTGRPNTVRSHTLPPGQYAPVLEDDGGVYFASPSGVVIAEPALRGTNQLPGGIYVPFNPELSASQYFGDTDDVDGLQRLPARCDFALRDASKTAS